MRLIKLLFFVAAVLTFEQAKAESYCQWAGGMIVDGGEDHETLKIVVSSVPRPKYPGHTVERPWCLAQRRALGGYQQMTMLTPPHLGQAQIKSYMVVYKSDRIGKDNFKIQVNWVGRSNEHFKGIMNVDVDVVDAPF